MIRVFVILIVVGFAVAGCSGPTPGVSLARKEALRKILVPEFAATSVSKDREDDFFHILEAFDADRRKNEFVRKVEFKSRSEATLDFADGGMHGGGTASVKKRDGKWVISEKLYFM